MQKVAVVGLGNIGKTHCKFYNENPNVELVAVCDLMEENANAVAHLYSAKPYDDIATMLAEEEIDVVSIATAGEENGGDHYEPAVLAIEAGKNTLVEKPISNDIVKARKMVQLAKEKNVRLVSNLNHRFVPPAYKGKELIEKGELGTLLFLNMKLTIQNPAETSPWFHLRALHPHSVDVMRYFAGDVKRVQAFMTKAPGREIWSTASINLEFASGAVGHLTGSYDMAVRHPIEYCEVAGNKGRFVIDNVYEHFTFYPHDSDELLTMRNSIMTGVGSFQETFKNRLDHFIQQIEDGVPPADMEASGAHALAGQEVIEAAIRSQLENGAVIDIPTVE
ncbi:Gfo/Idh/MocA family oxidoreductase [Gracilibacillus caseinilyticus]|uniref:Gfo/Idh/MocA family oxidoreductase n=1 Tax=Gracilibacillus caseinilyticus TaxID=2932256 RepID=A0ABY4F119_9BACI|nr:Gfo/Idh/MocA family oxidoreductase [Gracilibacillus caseinilyticus]UOQ50377.1 Gfo/Idh/MocA family oxidoreductase [Gracilibacillus caseinilyticus]